MKIRQECEPSSTKLGQNLSNILKDFQTVQTFCRTNDEHYSDAEKCASTEYNESHNKMPISSRMAKYI